MFKRMFTLIELIVVIVVIAILAAIVIPNISDIAKKAQVTALDADAQGIELAVDMYSLDNEDKVPTSDGLRVEKDTPEVLFKDELGSTISLQVKEVNVDKLVKEGYLKKAPKNKKVKFYLVLGGDVIWVLDDVIEPSKQPNITITIVDGEVKIKTEEEVVLQKYEKGNHEVEYFEKNGTIFTGGRFPVTEEGTYTFYYELEEGRKFVKEIEVVEDMLTGGSNSGSGGLGVIVESEPNVLITVSLGEVTVKIDKSTTLKKYETGKHGVDYFQSNGTVFTGETFIVSEVGFYTIYYKLTDNKEFVKVFEVTEDMLQQKNIEPEPIEPEPIEPEPIEPEPIISEEPTKPISYDDFQYTVNEKNVTITRYVGDSKNVIIPSHIEDKPVEVLDPYSFSNRGLISVVIPDTVTRIEEAAFVGNELLRVEIPEYVTFLGPSSFSKNKLVEVKLPSKLDNIDNNVFNNNLLTSIDIPNSVTIIGVGAFANNQLTSVVIPNKVTLIHASAFDSNKLREVTLSSSLVIMGMRAFHNNELTSITIPASFKNSGFQDFYGNPNLKTVINKSNIPNSTLMKQFDSSPVVTK